MRFDAYEKAWQPDGRSPGWLISIFPFCIIYLFFNPISEIKIHHLLIGTICHGVL